MNVCLKYQTQMPTETKQVVRDVQKKASQKENGSSKSWNSATSYKLLHSNAGPVLPDLINCQEQLKIQILCEIL